MPGELEPVTGAELGLVEDPGEPEIGNGTGETCDDMLGDAVPFVGTAGVAVSPGDRAGVDGTLGDAPVVGAGVAVSPGDGEGVDGTLGNLHRFFINLLACPSILDNWILWGVISHIQLSAETKSIQSASWEAFEGEVWQSLVDGAIHDVSTQAFLCSKRSVSVLCLRWPLCAHTGQEVPQAYVAKHAT